jgi:uncharacterized protein YndB with AHSA1/START domain
MRRLMLIAVTLIISILLILTACKSELATAPTPGPAQQETPGTKSAPTQQEIPAPTPKPEPKTQQTPELEPAAEPESEPPADTAPPPAVTGLIAADAYDGRVNLQWDKSAAEDFARYNIYMNQAEIADTSGMTPVHQITASATNNYQVTGLQDGTAYYFAVTAVDKSGNENTQAASVSATSTPMPRGTADPDISVDVYQSDKAWAGTTLMRDCHTAGRPRIIEVNMLGEIVWEYEIPQNLSRYTNPGLDVERLSNDNILFVLPTKGVYEIDRNGNIVWSYLTSKISHEADRLPNGNTIFVFGADDQKDDAQVTEVNPQGKIVWTWYARDHFDEPPYADIYDGGWTHTNSVTRLPNGNTLLSPRNFHFVVEVDPQGSVVRTIGDGILREQHDPEMLPNGNLLASSHVKPEQAVEIDPETGEVVWEFTIRERENYPLRDTNRLPNGNTLITGSTKVIEVTAEGEIVWQLSLGVTFTGMDAAGLGFYKAERINPEE